MSHLTGEEHKAQTGEQSAPSSHSWSRWSGSCSLHHLTVPPATPKTAQALPVLWPTGLCEGSVKVWEQVGCKQLRTPSVSSEGATVSDVTNPGGGLKR